MQPYMAQKGYEVNEIVSQFPFWDFVECNIFITITLFKFIYVTPYLSIPFLGFR